MSEVEIYRAFIIAMYWSGIGAMILSIIFMIEKSPVERAKGLEFLNPRWILNTYKVNVFGALLIAICLGILCPPVTILYYIYKLCTIKIGGKNEDADKT